jgi:hypothetical protein
MSEYINYLPIEEYQWRWECVRQPLVRKKLDEAILWLCKLFQVQLNAQLGYLTT